MKSQIFYYRCSQLLVLQHSQWPTTLPLEIPKKKKDTQNGRVQWPILFFWIRRLYRPARGFLEKKGWGDWPLAAGPMPPIEKPWIIAIWQGIRENGGDLKR